MPKAAVSRLRGPTEEAEILRIEFAAQVDARLRNLPAGHTANWGELATLMKEVALDVPGPEPRPDIRPWMKGRETDHENSKTALAAAQARGKAARAQPRPWTPAQHAEAEAAKQHTANQRRILRRSLKRWEEEWWEAVAEEAEAAARYGDQGKLWELLNRPRGRKALGTLDGTKKTGALPREETEAWGEHFENIQRGAGQVAERAWDSVPQEPETITWLGETPTRKGPTSAGSKMKLGKTGGDDAVVAEYLRNAGDQMREEVFALVQRHWEQAATAADGAESAEWPPEWMVGVVCPLW